MVESEGWSELSAGDDFAGYRIERRLGRGGMGILYLAIEPGLDRRVALKLIAPEAAVEEVFARRFAEESRIAASIEHPNVVPIYAAGEEGGVPYIAMRYVAGSDLGRRIAREGRLAPEQAVALIAQVANGLDAIHAAGLVHRDVKPANVLLSGEPGSEHAYITDFGVARNVATNSGLTQTGRFVGTLDYVAPEQISGAAVDARVDVYALGCLLYKLLTGEVPFPREGEAARLYAHLNDPPPAPSLLAPEVSMALDDVVARAMSKQPADRYPSAGDLGRAALAALSGTTPLFPERTVATGAAATVEPETVGPEPTRTSTPAEPTRESTPPEAYEPPPPTDETGRLRPEPAEALTEPDVRGPKRNPLLVGGGLAALAVVVIVAIVLASGGGGDGGEATGDTTAPADSTAKQTAKEKETPPEPDRLTGPQLATKANAICAQSKATFKETAAEFPEAKSEEVFDVGYSEALVGISTRAVASFKKLIPPVGEQERYRDYLDVQERIKTYDRDALEAAQAEDNEAYLEARERRNLANPERWDLARELGFNECVSPDD
jgi:serine/threonine protein kinase